MSGRCCQIRTGVLFLGFSLGSFELTLWVMLYTFRAGLREALGYSVKHEQDLAVASLVITIDFIVNVLLICGANKDYSGRRKDLRRWGWMIPWAFVYGVNILGLFAGSIVMFYSFVGAWKTLGLIPLFLGVGVLIGHCCVIFFIIEQKADLEIYIMQHQGQNPGSDPNSPS
ncbi:hypothetical protein TCAL_06637 [Tigriopus californicus]|uniref:Uncharacterized protein n=1 Tax=Tigriopus californicus TaxID=6832 RepID=A0A553PLX3_TIGCA|nr:hypothetical protein TCAL_06637 [Tigriopus californicus]|eukprot:TCALIF_06637-PA protein Name:"Protein of unknown function" AED:0.21 eAED:0.21 QI:13/1/0.5/1/1/1/2/0/170